MKLKTLCILALLLATFTGVSAQKVAVKSNLFYDAFANINLGVEVAMAPKWTLDVSGDFNAWNRSHDRKWKHWLIQPEARYWFCDRFSGHFLGVHAHGGQYNVGNLKNGLNFLGSDFRPLGDHRFQGWFVGAGVGYGYSWILNKHWNLEAEIGLGYAYTRYDSFECADCGKRVEKDVPHHYWGPTKAAINLIYAF